MVLLRNIRNGHSGLTASFLLNLALLNVSAVGIDSTFNPDSSLQRDVMTSFTLTLFARCILLIVIIFCLLTAAMVVKQQSLPS